MPPGTSAVRPTNGLYLLPFYISLTTGSCLQTYVACASAEFTVEKTPDDGQRDCPKHVEFRTSINLEISASVWFYCKRNI